ncbi:MAG TPA: TlpA disulfide reductase family protein [Polyangiaceae bacterium]|nr:TlpA disulfide reductase family protein [Polyangiaceae bacterium]
MKPARNLWRPWSSFALQVALVASVFVAVTAYQTRHHLARQSAPDFSLLDLSGNRVSLSQYRGKRVLLHFFATWCGVCRAELPSLRSLQRNLDADEALLAIVEDSDDVEAVRRFAREHELGYPILLGTREILRAYRVSSFPTNYYVNGDGTVRTTTVGLSTRLGMTLRLFQTRAN